MISVIICSRGPEFRKLTVDNIAATIGVPHEIVVVDNSENTYGICAAYNVGASRSRYDILCFAHEDIEFETNDWGRVVEQALRDNSVGVLGVTGGKWLAKAPGTWFSCGTKYLSSNVIDHSRAQDQPPRRHTYSNPENKPLVDVAAVDGLLISARRDVWQKYPFDEQTFPGFHFYDVDFCATVFQEYRVCVTLEICVTHFSRGNYNDAWFTAADRFYRKHASSLPLGAAQVGRHQVQQREYYLCKRFLQQIIERRLPAGIGYKYLVRCIALRPFDRDTLWLVRHYAALAWQSAKHK